MNKCLTNPFSYHLFVLLFSLIVTDPLTTLRLRAAEKSIKIGIAEMEITPEPKKDRPVYMAGFGHNRTATGILDPLFVRTLVLDDGEKKVALVSLDVIGYFYTEVQKIRSQLPKFDYILVSSTHNHEGPDTLGLWGKTPFSSGVDTSYLEKVNRRIIQTIQTAEKKTTSADVQIGKLRIPELVHDSRLPIVKHDELITLFFKERSSGHPIALLIQWNCHPETLGSKNTKISSDFVGATVREATRQLKCPTIYFTGTVGGLMSSLQVEIKDENGNLLKGGPEEKTELYGKKIAQKAIESLKNSEPIELNPIKIKSDKILIPMQNKLYQLGWKLGVLNRKAYLWNNDKNGKRELAKNLDKPIAIETEVGFLSLGELEIAIIPGEIYPELVLDKVENPTIPGADYPDAPIEPAIYKQLKSKHRMLIGLGNDEIGYIIPKRQWDENPPYCYGRKSSQYGEINSIGPDAAPHICKTWKELSNNK